MTPFHLANVLRKAAAAVLLLLSPAGIPALAQTPSTPAKPTDIQRDPELMKLATRTLELQLDECKEEIKDIQMRIRAANEVGASVQEQAARLRKSPPSAERTRQVEAAARWLARLTLPLAPPPAAPGLAPAAAPASGMAPARGASPAGSAAPAPASGPAASPATAPAAVPSGLTGPELMQAETELKDIAREIALDTFDGMRKAALSIQEATRNTGGGKQWPTMLQKLGRDTGLLAIMEDMGLNGSDGNGFDEKVKEKAPELAAYMDQRRMGGRQSTAALLDPDAAEALRVFLDKAYQSIQTRILSSLIKERVEGLCTKADEMVQRCAEVEKLEAPNLKLQQDLHGKINHELAQRDNVTNRQTQVAESLTMVIICVLGSMVFGLLIVRFRTDDLAVLLVRERTVVEVVSIGAFLAVVLYLGAGEFVQKETLGTLLGTLAGYLFTRRGSSAADATGSGAGAGGGAVPTLTLGTPGKPEWSLPTRTLTLPTATPGATKHWVWMMDLATKTAQKVGETSTRSFIIPGASLSSGHNYQAWFQAVNAAGDGPEGPRVDFQA